MKGRGFDKSRRIGAIQDRIRLLERRDIDELIILDISGGAPRFEQVKQLCDPLFCPVTIGGGIKSIADIRRLLADGADKVAVCSEAIKRPAFITEAAEKFGSQAVSVHAVARDMGCVEFARECEAKGAGELILTAHDRDGTMEGYDLHLIRAVTAAVSIPVVACGGCGTYQHMQQALDAGAHAVAAGAMFQFREATPKGASRFLHDQGFQVRL